jgi:hypothetical protein
VQAVDSCCIRIFLRVAVIVFVQEAYIFYILEKALNCLPSCINYVT